MELYVKVSFWIGFVCLLIRLAKLGVTEWPEERKPKTIGDHCAETILGLAFTIWAGICLWVLK